MGCRESKHIATDNTIISPTSSTKSNDKNNAQTFQKSGSERSTIQNNEGDSKANNVLNENKNSGDGKGKGIESEKEGGKLQETNDQIVEGDKESIKENAEAGEQDQNGNVGENGGKESSLIPKEDLPSTSTKDGESIKAINTDGVSGASVHSTPTEVPGASDNRKTENAEEKKEPVEETKDTKTEADDTTEKENLTTVVDAYPDNHVLEAEVVEKIKEAEAAVATPENHLGEDEVEEKIKDAEAAVDSLEKLVTIKNPVKETEETSENEGEATNSSIQNPDKETDKSEEILKTQVAATDATPQNPVEQTDKFEENPGIETKATDATAQNVVTESDRTEENLKEAAENGVKEIHEVTGKAEEIPVKEVETFYEAKQDNHALVADEAEEVLENKAEADKIEDNLVTAAEAANTAVKNLESVAKVQSQDAANTDKDTKNSSTAQLSKEDPDAQKETDRLKKQ